MSADKKGARLIKKYSNRRLYDMAQSRYVTLEELKDMVLAGTEFSVVTAKGEDITAATLMSALLSCEVMGQPVFSEQNLRNMVMFMHGPMRGPAKVFLEQCMPLFTRTHKKLTERFGGDIDGKALESLAALQGGFVRQMMEQYVCRNLENYLAAQKNMEKLMEQTMSFPKGFPNFMGAPAGDDGEAKKTGDGI